MDMETNKEGYYEFSVEWYEDPEVLQMVKKRLISPSTAKTTDTSSLQEMQWYENPEIVQILKKMFGPSLPEITSFLSRCPQGFEIDLQLVRWSRDPDISKMLYNRRFEPLLNEDGKPQAIFLQEAWLKVKSALKKYGIICRLDVVFGYITIKTTKTTDPDIIVKAKQLVHLLSIRIPVNQVQTVVNSLLFVFLICIILLFL